MKNVDMVEGFLCGAITNKKNGNIRIEGCNFINYSTVIARKTEGNKVLLNTNKYSSTTSTIQNMLKREIERYGYILVEVGENMNE